MKFKGSMHQRNDKGKGENGLFAVHQSVKSYIPLGDYCCALLSAAFEFAADSGATVEEMNEAIEQVRKTIANLQYIETPQP